MNIWGVMPNVGEVINVKSADKSTNNLSNYKGPSFIESMRSVAQSANLQVADGSSSAMLNFNRSKEEKLEKLFSFTETEEEILDESLSRIKKLLKDLKK